MSEIYVTKKNFNEEVLKSDKPVLVDFYATWCNPCSMQSPIVSEIAEEYNDKIKVCKLDIDENEEIADKYRITSIPTIKIFENGKVVKTSAGLTSKDNLKSFIDKY